MIKDKISHLHTIWADLCKTMNKPGGMTAAEAIGASTGPVNDQAVRLRTWYEQSGLVPWHSRQAMTTTVFDATLRGLCGVVVNGLTLCMTTDGFKVTGDVLGEASDTLRALTTLAPRSPDMPVSEDLYAVAKVIEHKIETLTKERDGLRRDLISARSKVEALTIQGQIADGAYQSLRRFVTYAILDVNEIAKLDLRSDPDLTQSTDMLCAELRGVTQQAVNKYKSMGQSIASLCTLVDPNTPFVLTKNKDLSEDLRLLTLLLRDQAKREDQDRLALINDLQDHTMDLREALGWSEPITGKRVTETLAMTVDRVKSEIMAVREAMGVLPTMAFAAGVREVASQYKSAAEQSAIQAMRTTTDILDRVNEARAEMERMHKAMAEKIKAQDIALIFAEDMARFKAANYLEYRFNTESGTTYTVTVKRLGAGKTPGEIAAQNARRAAKYKALCKSLLARLHKDAPQKDWTLAVTPNPDSNLISGLTPDQERAALMIWPTCGGAFKIGETQVMAYRGTAEQVAGVAEYLGKHGFGVAWERQT